VNEEKIGTLRLVINRKRHVGADTASRSGHGCGASPQLATNLQNRFDPAIARKRSGEVIAVLPTRPEGEKQTNTAGSMFRTPGLAHFFLRRTISAFSTRSRDRCHCEWSEAI
jgi:hypothetical protein